MERLKQLAVLSGIPRLYVHAADTGEPVELSGLDLDDPESWAHTEDANDMGDHTAEVDG